MRSFLAIITVLSALSHNRSCLGQEFKVFVGNLHSHTSYSDGSGLPHQAYRHARLAGQLDFLAITEHSHKAAEQGAKDRKDGVLIATNPALYDGADEHSLISTARKLTEDGKFVALYGQEWSTIGTGNHICVFDAPKVIDAPNGRFDKLLDWLAEHPDSTGKPCVLQFNHPALGKSDKTNYGRDDFPSEKEWLSRMGSLTHSIEVLNGPAMTRDSGERPQERMERFYLKYLNMGFRLAPTADQDNHYFTWGTATDARTGIIAKNLTKVELLNALRARHAYATEDKNLRIVFKIANSLCGDGIAAPAAGSSLPITCSISDDDEPEASYQIDVFADQVGGGVAQVVDTFTGQTDREGTEFSVEDISYDAYDYVFLKITQVNEDGHDDQAWTAPIWFKRTTAQDTPKVADGSNTAQFVASKKSNVYHLSLDCKDAQNIVQDNRIVGPQAADGRRLHKNCPRH